MKCLIFSDVHLSEKFEVDKFKFLMKIIFSADKVIIAGDFYDQYFTTLDRVLNSKWKPLFNLLKEKKAIYIPGNHDLLNGNNREYNFCGQITEEYQFESGKRTFRVCHGHKIAHSLSIFERNLPRPIRNLFTNLESFVENFLVKIFGWWAPNLFIHRYLDLLKTIIYKRGSRSNENWLILGHIHLPYLNKQLKYANTGFINYGLASYITVVDGVVRLHKEKY